MARAPTDGLGVAAQAAPQPPLSRLLITAGILQFQSIPVTVGLFCSNHGYCPSVTGSNTSQEYESNTVHTEPT